MNFLAHLYLGQKPEELMIGNFMGDFVKGRAFENYSPMIQKGIILHREIDAFTDDHEIVKSSKKRLVPKYRHYSAVIVDMFYDHFLAANWKKFHDKPLEEFAASCYAILNSHSAILPPRANYMLPYMIRHDWLLGYSTTEGIGRALEGLSRRSRFVSHMEEATDDLLRDYAFYKNEFLLFFPDLIKHTDRWKKENIIL